MSAAESQVWLKRFGANDDFEVVHDLDKEIPEDFMPTGSKMVDGLYNTDHISQTGIHYYVNLATGKGETPVDCVFYRHKEGKPLGGNSGKDSGESATLATKKTNRETKTFLSNIDCLVKIGPKRYLQCTHVIIPDCIIVARNEKLDYKPPANNTFYKYYGVGTVDVGIPLYWYEKIVKDIDNEHSPVVLEKSRNSAISKNDKYVWFPMTPGLNTSGEQKKDFKSQAFEEQNSNFMRFMTYESGEEGVIGAGSLYGFMKNAYDKRERDLKNLDNLGDEKPLGVFDENGNFLKNAPNFKGAAILKLRTKRSETHETTEEGGPSGKFKELEAKKKGKADLRVGPAATIVGFYFTGITSVTIPATNPGSHKANVLLPNHRYTYEKYSGYIAGITRGPSSNSQRRQNESAVTGRSSRSLQNRAPDGAMTQPPSGFNVKTRSSNSGMSDRGSFQGAKGRDSRNPVEGFTGGSRNPSASGSPPRRGKSASNEDVDDDEDTSPPTANENSAGSRRSEQLSGVSRPSGIIAGMGGTVVGRGRKRSTNEGKTDDVLEGFGSNEGFPADANSNRGTSLGSLPRGMEQELEDFQQD